MRICYLQILLISLIFVNSEAVVKRSSYICLHYDDDLCLGVSPGDGQAPNFALPIQLKRRLNNEAKGTDKYKVGAAVDIFLLSRERL